MRRLLVVAAILSGLVAGIVYAIAISVPGAVGEPVPPGAASESAPRDVMEPKAAERCATAAAAFSNGAVVAAFEVTAEEVASWQERKHQMVNPPIRDQLSPSAPVAVCYFDGEFGPARAPAGFDVPDYDRIVVLIGPDGKPQLYVSAHRNSFPIEDPTAP